MKKVVLLRQDSVVAQPIVIAIVSALVGFIFIVVKLQDLPDVVPIFYSLPRASERLGAKEWLYILPGSSLLISFFNTLFILYFIERDTVMSRILALTSLLVALLSLYTLVRIIFLIA